VRLYAQGSAGFGVASSSFDLIGAALFGPSALSSEEASQIAGTAEEKARKMRDEKFRRELNQQNLVVHDMADDGNCLFSAVAHQIYNDPELHVTTRAQCYNYMERNRSYYSGFVLEDFDKYLSKQRNNKEWGGHLELRAFGEIYNRNVIVYDELHVLGS